MVANSIVYHPTIAHYLRFVATTVGRDKVLRVLQYFSRFYAWYLFRTNAFPSSIAPFAAMKNQFGLIRKALRIGKNVEHFKAAAVAADTKGSDTFLKYCAAGRQLGYAFYLTFDMCTYLDSAGIWKMEASKRLLKKALQAWVAGLVFSIAGSVYSLYKLRGREALVTKEDGEGVVESKRIQKERAAINLQLISDLCDLTIPTSGMGWVNLDEGIVGLAGTVSSLIGLHGAWKRTA